MRLRITFLSFLCFVWLCPCAKSEEQPAPSGKKPYEIVSAKDYSRGEVVCLSFRVLIPAGTPRENVLPMAREIMQKVRARRNVNALELLFYDDIADLDGPFTVAGVQWAPFGNWNRAGEASTGDYSKHEYAVIFASRPDGLDGKEADLSPAFTTTEKETGSAIDEREKTEADILRLMRDWEAAWERKDLDRFLSFYSPHFHTADMDRQAFAERKRKIFARTRHIRVTLTHLRIETIGTSAVVTFLQHYNGDNYSDKGQKTLYLARTPGGWQIVREEWKPAP